MLHVGITGGMGSGKSTVARFFQVLGIPVYFADEEAKRLMNLDPALKQAITAIFGNKAYLDNELNRAFISAAAFSDPGKLTALNAVVHPAVMAHGQQWMLKQTAPYTLKEAALLFESGSNKQLDVIIGVWCPLELRLERVMKRDGSSSEEVMARMQKQMGEEEKMKKCDFIITNDEKEPIIPQVLDLHARFLAQTV